MKTNIRTKNNGKALGSRVDALLADIKHRQQVLISPGELWDEELDIEPEASGYLQALLEYGDVKVCADPGLHRAHFRYIGNGHYVCEICQRFASEVS